MAREHWIWRQEEEELPDHLEVLEPKCLDRCLGFVHLVVKPAAFATALVVQLEQLLIHLRQFASLPVVSVGSLCSST